MKTDEDKYKLVKYHQLMFAEQTVIFFVDNIHNINC